MVTKKTSTSRGRPRSFDVDAATETAMRLFHARGYDGVGVAELVAALGVKPPSFYAAFGSKAGLFERALQRYALGEGNIFARARTGNGSVAEVIERTLVLAAEVYPCRDGTAGCLVLDGARNSVDPEVCSLAAAAMRASRKVIRDFIATESPERADVLADFVLVTMMGMSAAARDGADAAMLGSIAAIAGRAFRQEIAAD